MYSYVRLIIINHSSLSLQVCMFRIISSTINPCDSGMFNLTSTLVDVCNRAGKLMMTEVRLSTRIFELAFNNEMSLSSVPSILIGRPRASSFQRLRHSTTSFNSSFQHVQKIRLLRGSEQGRTKRKTFNRFISHLIHELEQIECAIYSRRSVDGRHDADGVGSVVKDAALSADRLHRDVVVHASRAEQGEGI